MRSDLNVVVIGGGTGLSILLAGLKKYTQNITAIVNVVDDGGGSGRLREDLGMLPPGDIRSCLVALAERESELQKIFQYRFSSGEMKGQNFGNIFLAAMNEIYGSFETAVEKTADVLAIVGRVIPMTLDDVKITAQLENGDIIEGESKIPQEVLKRRVPINHVYLNIPHAKAPKRALEAIENADIVLLGPGSLYTSIIPNLLVEDIPKALQSTKAPVNYIANVMTQPGETEGYTILDHFLAMHKHAPVDYIERVFYNTESIPYQFSAHYFERSRAVPLVMSDEEKDQFQSMGIETVGGRFIEVKQNYIRHDADALCALILESHTRIYRA